jgi:YD repeat-containing protein
VGGTQRYWYDANGNAVTRTVGASSYALTYDGENRLTTVSGAATASFVYDGDGQRVKGTVCGVTTAYLGGYYEWTGSAATAKSYYRAGSQIVALRVGTTLHFLLGDHLGSTSKTANASGSLLAELRYKPWGETRYTSGTTPTSVRFTGQQEESGLAFAAPTRRSLFPLRAAGSPCPFLIEQLPAIP